MLCVYYYVQSLKQYQITRLGMDQGSKKSWRGLDSTPFRRIILTYFSPYYRRWGEGGGRLQEWGV